MWDLRVANPFGRLSIRNMLIFVAAVVATAFAFNLLTAPVTHAADAVWDGDSITYADNQYQKIADSKEGDGLNLPAGSHVYAYIGPKDDSSSTSTQQAHIIYFAPSEDPTKSKSAKYATYDFTPPATYKNPTDQKTLSLEEKSGDKSGTSCSIPGIGWIVCPVSNFLATSVDWMYSNVLTQFLAVRPVETTPDSSLFRAWAIMRNFANVAFVIAFLIIIWSQVSSIGISNYGIKKMLPRLVVAAVLVNISYWICAVAIDVSNILGYSLNDLFMSITKTVQGSGSNTGNVLSFQSVTTAVLSGIGLSAAGVTAVLAIGSLPGAIALLLPVLLGVIIAALVAVVVMAARQAIIVILVIVAPLAFVAYLLPNTEKYFEKWKDLFTTMLMLFPIFSVLFGGSQLAGTAIIQNADSIIMIILGMAVQVAPLVILPFLIKFSGSLLSRIAGMANDRSKGLIDRSRGFANDYAEAKKAETLGRTRRRGLLTRGVQRIDNGRRTREGKKKANEDLADARWEGHKNAHKVHEAGARAALIKEAAQTKSEAHIEEMKRRDPGMQGLHLQAQSAKVDLDQSKAKVEAGWENFKAGDARDMVTPEGLSVSALADFAHERNALAKHVQEASRDTTMAGLRKRSAERKQAADLTDSLIKNTVTIDGQKISEYGGGVLGVTGAETVLADAVNTYRSEYRARIGEKEQLIKHFNLSDDERQALAMGSDVKATKNGLNYIFRAEDDYAREAAIDAQMKGGSVNKVRQIVNNSGEAVPQYNETTGQMEVKPGVTFKYRTSISDAIRDNNLQKKAIFWGSQTLNDIAQGKINGEDSIRVVAARSLIEGKVSDEAVSGMHASALKRLIETTENDAMRSDKYQEAKTDEARQKVLQMWRDNHEMLYTSAEKVLDSDILSRNADQAAKDELASWAQHQRNNP